MDGRVAKILVVASSILLANCGASQSSPFKNTHLNFPQLKNSGEIYVSLVPTEQGAKLYVSSDIQFNTIDISATNNDRTETMTVDAYAMTAERRAYISQNILNSPADTLLTITASNLDRSETKEIRLADLLAVPEFGFESTRKITAMVTSAGGLAQPRDLEFNPLVPNELWVVNRDSEGVVIVHGAGEPGQIMERRTDSFHGHFMSQVSSIAFGSNGFFASCQESRNENWGSYDFMGPTLWTSDLAIFANVNQRFIPNATCGKVDSERELLGSHMDMLHQSPLCMGIAHSQDNGYWVFDGKNSNLVHYDFVQDHGPGESDHSDGELRRYEELKLNRIEGIPSHMVADPSSNWLYIADTGTGKIIRFDTTSGMEGERLRPRGEPLAKYVSMDDAKFETFANGLRQPTGLAIHEDKLFVSDFASGEILAYSLVTGEELDRIDVNSRGLMGITISPSGKLWFVDSKEDIVYALVTD